MVALAYLGVGIVVVVVSFLLSMLLIALFGEDW